MSQTLSHTLITASDDAPERWLYVLHGIYGMGRNWVSIARRLVKARPDWGVVLVDLRMHGDSQGFAPPHTVETAAGDLDDLIRITKRSADAVLGHSFGGKVALLHAARSEAPPAQVWIIDSTPEAREPSGTAWEVIEVLRSLPDSYDDRAEAVESVMEAGGFPRPMAQWLSMNLEHEGERYHWRIDVDAMEALLEDFFDRDLWGVVEDPPAGSEIHFVKAEDSETLREEVAERVERAGKETERVHLHRMPGGHWLNVENPDGILELLSSRLVGTSDR